MDETTTKAWLILFLTISIVLTVLFQFDFLASDNFILGVSYFFTALFAIALSYCFWLDHLRKKREQYDYWVPSFSFGIMTTKQTALICMILGSFILGFMIYDRSNFYADSDLSKDPWSYDFPIAFFIFFEVLSTFVYIRASVIKKRRTKRKIELKNQLKKINDDWQEYIDKQVNNNKNTLLT